MCDRSLGSRTGTYRQYTVCVLPDRKPLQLDKLTGCSHHTHKTFISAITRNLCVLTPTLTSSPSCRGQRVRETTNPPPDGDVPLPFFRFQWKCKDTGHQHIRATQPPLPQNRPPRCVKHVENIRQQRGGGEWSILAAWVSFNLHFYKHIIYISLIF